MSQLKEKREYYKSEARFLLKYNYIRQIFMTAIIMFITAGFNTLKNSIIILLNFEKLYVLPLRIFFDILILVLVIPLWMGIFYVSQKLFDGERLTIGAMFEFYSSSSSMLNCLKFACSLFLRYILFFVPFLVFGAMLSNIRLYIDELFYNINIIKADIIMVCVCIVFFAAFFVCLVFMMRYFAAIFVFIKNPYMSTGEVMKKSILIMRKRKIEAVCFILSFTLWIIGSYLLAGVPFIFFTIPYIVLSYSSFFSSAVYIFNSSDEEQSFFNTIGDMIDESKSKTYEKRFNQDEEVDEAEEVEGEKGEEDKKNGEAEENELAAIKDTEKKTQKKFKKFKLFSKNNVDTIDKKQ